MLDNLRGKIKFSQNTITCTYHTQRQNWGYWQGPWFPPPQMTKKYIYIYLGYFFLISPSPIFFGPGSLLKSKASSVHDHTKPYFVHYIGERCHKQITRYYNFL